MYDHYGVDGCIYIRPDRGDKPFIGQVKEVERFDKDMAEIASDMRGDNNQLCVVCESRGIDAEWRFFATKDGIVTGSQYKKSGKLYVENTFPKEVEDLANEVARAWQPSPVFVIDICKSGDEFRLVEINSAASSGYYACSPDAIVDAMTKAAVKEWKEINA